MNTEPSDAKRSGNRVLVILGHPREPSLCSAIADAYAEGAGSAGAEIRLLRVGSMEFDPDVRPVSPVDQPLEPDLEKARRLIAWSDHLVFIWPAWWGTVPARLKGFLDRVLLPGFAFREREDGSFEGLLKGRTAHLIITMDMPAWVYRILFRAPGLQAMKRSSLGFCGISTTRSLLFGPVKDSDAAERSKWLNQARQLGCSLRTGARSRPRRLLHKSSVWIRALRLQFYPMTWIAYTVGALGAAAATGEWSLFLYLTGFAFLFFLEAATVFINERVDYESDLQNRNYGPFTGGSRVLVDRLLEFRELTCGIGVALALTAGCAVLILMSAGGGFPLFILVAAMVILALGYTAPPLKLSWRGLGELDVGFTHSLGSVLCGYLILGGSWSDPFPWLVSLPLFLSIMPSIILAGIPDLEADRSAGKKTLAVRLGSRRAKRLAIAMTGAALVSVLLLTGHPVLEGIFGGLLLWILPHGLILSWLLYQDQKTLRTDGKKDLLMAVSLSYIFWFGLIPLINLF